MKIIIFANFKGGVAKTTTAHNVAAQLAIVGYRTLMVDADPQCNLTMACGQLHEDKKTFLEVFNKQRPDICNVSYDLDLIKGDIRLAVADLQFSGMINREHMLNKFLELPEIANRYDFVIIDCPPYLGLLTQNALMTGGYIFTPVDCEYFSTYGLTFFNQFLEDNEFQIDGIVLTKAKERLVIHKGLAENIRESYGAKVLNEVIPLNTEISKAQANETDIFNYSPTCKGALAYEKLTKEILTKIGEND